MCIGTSSDDRALLGEQLSGMGLVGSCSRRPTVEISCVHDGRLRANGSPFGQGTFRWFVDENAAEIEGEGGYGTPSRGRQTVARVGVEYGVDYVFSDPARMTRYFPPRILHFVWAGGTRIMHQEAFRSVMTWAAQNRDWDVYIWVDLRTDATVATKYETDYGRAMDRVKLKDIEAENVSSPYIRYEIDRLWPNYGASSDLLRYAILHKYGGAYFDADVPPGATPLNRFASGGFCANFIVNNNSQNQHRIGNDAFLCTPGHELIAAISQVAVANYPTIVSDYYGSPNSADDYDTYGYKMNATVHRTGPGAVRKVLIDRGLIRDEAGQLPGCQRFAPGVISIPAAATNTQGWLKVPITACAQAVAVAKAAAAMRFELEVMGIFRTRDHVCQAAVACGRRADVPTERLDGYTGNFYTIKADEAVTAGETELARDIEALLPVHPDLTAVRRNQQQRGFATEAANRYPVFRNLWDACRA